MFRPSYIFEVSWEVCNKVGGIYAVLATRAKTMVEGFGKNNVVFVGPLFKQNALPKDFSPTKAQKFEDFKRHVAEKYGLEILIGRWQVPGKPLAILVDFTPLYEQKNQIYGKFWERFGVNSLNAYGDYDEASMFGYASGVVIAEFSEYFGIKDSQVAHFNEWMTAFGLFYIKAFAPQIRTLFTTHATTIGRSIAGNGKPLYQYLQAYQGDQMAHELNVEAKHSAEKQAAHHADCFTTVSQITAEECEALLDKRPDVVTPNGFELDFVPQADEYQKKRLKARNALKRLAEKTLGYKLSENPCFIGISGRYEYKNKGIDVFIDVINHLRGSSDLEREVVAFIIVPAWIKEGCYSNSKFATTALVQESSDLTLNYIMQKGFDNAKESKAKIIFIPTYLDGKDGVMNMPYYDILIGLDLTLFPSYYEPWGYTPMESAAFGIPTLTTSLSGFGRWVRGKEESTQIEHGVAVIERTENNYFQVVEDGRNEILKFISATEPEQHRIRLNASKIARKATWDKFFCHYEKAYHIAMKGKR